MTQLTAQFLASLAFWGLLAVVVAIPLPWLLRKMPANYQPSDVDYVVVFLWAASGFSVCVGFTCDVLPRLYGVLMEVAK